MRTATKQPTLVCSAVGGPLNKILDNSELGDPRRSLLVPVAGVAEAVPCMLPIASHKVDAPKQSSVRS